MITRIVIVSSLQKKLMAGNYVIILKKFRQLNLVNHFVHLVFCSRKSFGFKIE